MSISHIQICYQLLQTHPSAHSLNPPIRPFLKPTHPSETNPQPFCLPGDDCRTYGRLTDPKKNHPQNPSVKSMVPPAPRECNQPACAAHCIANSSQRIDLRSASACASRASQRTARMQPARAHRIASQTIRAPCSAPPAPITSPPRIARSARRTPRTCSSARASQYFALVYLVRGTNFSKIQYIYIFIPEFAWLIRSYWLSVKIRCSEGSRFELRTQSIVISLLVRGDVLCCNDDNPADRK